MKLYNRLFIITLIIIIVITGCSKSDETIMEDSPLTSETEKRDDEKNQESEIETSKTSEEEQEKLPDEKQEITEDTEKETDETSLLQENNAETISEPSKTEEVVLDNNDDVTAVENQDNSEALDAVTLKIEGLAENQLSFSLDELKAMKDMIYETDFYSLNSFGTTGYTHFKGVNLWSLLYSNSFISDEASKVTVVAQDGYKMEFTMEQVKRQDYIDETNPDAKHPMIIAWEENGEEYSSEEGAPFKLVVGQKEAGDVNKPQWVSNIDKIVIE